MEDDRQIIFHSVQTDVWGEIELTVFIGIDGGGTKTSAVAADESGQILGRAKAGASNPNGQPLAHIRDVFQSIRRQLSPFVRNWADCIVFAGIAGTTHQAKHDQVLTCLQSVYSDVRELLLDHDAMSALASVTYGDPGVIQIAGTGSVTFGLGANGERCRIGGWGYLLGDEGSGFDLGRRALTHVMRDYDGRGPATELTNLAIEKWGLGSPEDILPLVYGNDVKQAAASFTYELFQAVQSGDCVARKIVSDAAEDLAEAIYAAFKRLDFVKANAADVFAPGSELSGASGTVMSSVPVGLIGGAFQPPMIDALRLKVAQRFPNAPQLIRPNVEPVIGSLVWAYKHAGLDPKRILKFLDA